MSTAQDDELWKTAAAGIAASLALAGCGKEQAQQAPPPPEVTVQTVDSRPVPLELTYTARTVGSREVEVRARVGGIVLKRRFEEGSRVVQGQPMFLIDPEPVRARAGFGARGSCRCQGARWTKRAASAIACCRCSRRTRSARAGATKRCRASKSRRRTCRRPSRSCAWRSSISEYTDVRAPITGLTSREMLSEGSLISTDQASSLLTKIVQVDPLYVEFSVPEAEAAMIRGGLAPANKSAPPPGVKLMLEDGSEYPAAGARSRSSTTPWTAARAPCKCAPCCRTRTRSCFPASSFARRVEGIQLSNVVSVPRKAVMSSAQGPFVWIVGDDRQGRDAPGADRPRPRQQHHRDRWPAGRRSLHRRRRAEGVQPGIQVSAVSAEEAARKPQRRAAEAARRLHDLEVLHHAADLRLRHLGVHRDRRARRHARAADLRLSRHHSADGDAGRALSGRDGRDHRGNRRGAAGAGDQRRREHAVHAVGQLGRRHADDQRHVRRSAPIRTWPRST